MRQSSLLSDIEQCRREMITLSHSHGLNSKIVIQVSKRLDHLLNLYQTRYDKQLVSSH